MFRKLGRDANSKDLELREAVNKAIGHFEAKSYFLADESIVAVWNIFFPATAVSALTLMC